MKGTLPLKPLDFAAILFSAALTVFSAFMVYGRPRDAAQVFIQGEGRTWVFPSDAEETVSIPGPVGDTVVEISGGRSRILSSPCNNQICVAAGHIHRQGQWVACLPNKVFLYIEGTGDENTELDSIAW
ncbi:NusG domain II-containing protein [Treponema primitia]|uniref:NusG domain II-containing protein n=1 Tax=Treponema primitia TaxID=88058 RepID=UPI0002555661|nr:NusG domain II-containing protein [Treponema primitia]